MDGRTIKMSGETFCVRCPGESLLVQHPVGAADVELWHADVVIFELDGHGVGR